MKPLNYSAISALGRLSARAAQAWNRALNRDRLIIETSVNVANVIINFGSVDRTQSGGRVAQHSRRGSTHHITLAADVRWSITPWQRFWGLGSQDAYAALLHEFGHALGLPHSDVFSDVMHPELGSTVISADEAVRARAFLKL